MTDASPSWSQLARRLLALWRLRKVHYTVCAECRFPFLLNDEGRDTATLEVAEIRLDGTALCGECAVQARADRKKAEAKAAKRSEKVQLRHQAKMIRQLIGAPPARNAPQALHEEYEFQRARALAVLNRQRFGIAHGVPEGGYMPATGSCIHSVAYSAMSSLDEPDYNNRPAYLWLDPPITQDALLRKPGEPIRLGKRPVS